MAIVSGSEAPEFNLPDQSGGKVSLLDYRGEKNVVLMFYPFAFTGVCTKELCTLRDEYPDFMSDDSVLLSVSCDSTHSLKKFAEEQNLTHPMLSDFWPHGAVSRAYGVFLEDVGFSTRGTFIIDKQGIVQWSVVNGPGEQRSTEDYRAALAAL